jgi:hypothetical protein
MVLSGVRVFNSEQLSMVTDFGTVQFDALEVQVVAPRVSERSRREHRGGKP